MGNIIVDTDFHQVKRSDGKEVVSFKEVNIGENNWIGFRCTLLKGTITPSYTIVGANSFLNKRYDGPEYTLIAGNPAQLKFTGIYREVGNDKITYTDI